MNPINQRNVDHCKLQRFALDGLKAELIARRGENLVGSGGGNVIGNNGAGRQIPRDTLTITAHRQ